MNNGDGIQCSTMDRFSHDQADKPERSVSKKDADPDKEKLITSQSTTSLKQKRPPRTTVSPKRVKTSNDEDPSSSESASAMTYTCGVCSRSFEQLEFFKNHARMHRKGKPFACDKCGDAFPCFSEWAAHLASHQVAQSGTKENSDNPMSEDEDDSGEGSLTCRYCKTDFEREEDFSAHCMVQEEGKVAFRCCVCSKQCQYRHQLSSHLSYHVCEIPFTPQAKHRCLPCKKAFARRGHLAIHEKYHDKPFTCSTCTRAYPSAEKLASHMKMHSRRKTHTCNECGKSFVWYSQLLDHKHIHAVLDEYRCNVCGMSFSSWTGLKLHLRKHKGWNKPLVDPSDEEPKEKFPCPQCSCVFRYPMALQLHSVHHSTMPHQCEVCGEGMSNPSSQGRHLLAHNQGRLHACGKCGVGFKLDFYRERHEKTCNATEPTPFSCEICHQGFSSAAKQRRHRRLHMKVNICQYCGKYFGDSYQLKNHERLHTGEQPYLCDKCPQKFATSSKLRLHRHNMHFPHQAVPEATDIQDVETPDGPKTEFKCSQCPKVFTCTNAFRTHQRYHAKDKSLTCTICGRTLSHTGSLNNHMMMHHNERPFVCEFCGKAFIDKSLLKRHSRVHTGEKPYQCESCGRCFSQSSSLKYHRRLHTNPSSARRYFFFPHSLHKQGTVEVNHPVRYVKNPNGASVLYHVCGTQPFKSRKKPVIQNDSPGKADEVANEDCQLESRSSDHHLPHAVESSAGMASMERSGSLSTPKQPVPSTSAGSSAFQHKQPESNGTLTSTSAAEVPSASSVHKSMDQALQPSNSECVQQNQHQSQNISPLHQNSDLQSKSIASLSSNARYVFQFSQPLCQSVTSQTQKAQPAPQVSVSHSPQQENPPPRKTSAPLLQNGQPPIRHGSIQYPRPRTVTLYPITAQQKSEPPSQTIQPACLKSSPAAQTPVVLEKKSQLTCRKTTLQSSSSQVSYASQSTVPQNSPSPTVKSHASLLKAVLLEGSLVPSQTSPQNFASQNSSSPPPHHTLSPNSSQARSLYISYINHDHHYLGQTSEKSTQNHGSQVPPQSIISQASFSQNTASHNAQSPSPAPQPLTQTTLSYPDVQNPHQNYNHQNKIVQEEISLPSQSSISQPLPLQSKTVVPQTSPSPPQSCALPVSQPYSQTFISQHQKSQSPYRAPQPPSHSLAPLHQNAQSLCRSSPSTSQSLQLLIDASYHISQFEENCLPLPADIVQRTLSGLPQDLPHCLSQVLSEAVSQAVPKIVSQSVSEALSHVLPSYLSLPVSQAVGETTAAHLLRSLSQSANQQLFQAVSDALSQHLAPYM